MTDTRRRALIAATLGLLVTGLGHAYLREWRRALGWLVFVLGASVVLSVTPAVPADQTLSEWPVAALLFVLLLQVASVFDAYVVARRRPTRASTDENEASCPNCGREVDPAMGFCWYCSEQFEGSDAADETEGHVAGR